MSGYVGVPKNLYDLIAASQAAADAAQLAADAAQAAADAAQVTADSATTVEVLTGEAVHGGSLPILDGYLEEECKFIVSMKDVPATAYGPIRCWEIGRVVTAQYWANNVGNDEWMPGTANYMVVGVRLSA